jgi:hypothetical protein
MRPLVTRRLFLLIQFVHYFLLCSYTLFQHNSRTASNHGLHSSLSRSNFTRNSQQCATCTHCDNPVLVQCSSTFFNHCTPNFNNGSWGHTTKFRLAERRYKTIRSHKKCGSYVKTVKLYWSELIGSIHPRRLSWKGHLQMGRTFLNLRSHPMPWRLLVPSHVHVEGKNQDK